MDLIKQYIIQSISAASNNLRLNTQQIEVVALLREAVIKSKDLENDIKGMKKLTELSTLAIRLNEIYSYLTNNQIDFLKFSEKFKQHSSFLIKDLSHMLEMVNPTTFNQALNKLNSNSVESSPSEDKKSVEIINNSDENSSEELSIDLSNRKSSFEDFEKNESDKIKEELILEEEKEDEDLFFQNYESTILKPIKPVDAILKQLSKNESNPEELLELSNIMKKNGELSAKIGFEIIANMHRIIAKSLLLIRSRELMPGKEVIESIRACLIVIVAVVKGKEVDITNYLNKSEEFAKKIQTLTVKE